MGKRYLRAGCNLNEVTGTSWSYQWDLGDKKIQVLFEVDISENDSLEHDQNRDGAFLSPKGMATPVTLTF